MTDNQLTEIKNVLQSYGIAYAENEPMSQHTSFKIGGPAGLYVCPETSDEVRITVEAARAHGVRTYVLGRGTNVVFADSGFDGLVISMLRMDRVIINGNTVTAGCGATLAKTAVAARDAGLTGMEFAHGIPGSVGGAVFMNAGAYGGEISGILRSSTYLDINTGEIHVIDTASHRFGYRDSLYKHHPEYVIIEASFGLSAGEKDLIAAKMDELITMRREKQPLEYPSAGSAFKRYPGRYTAQMIDEAGLKGKQIGGAQVSEKHAGFIINKGGATAADVRALVDAIKDEIFKLYGIEIESEILFVD